jgi:hypothetical protein
MRVLRSKNITSLYLEYTKEANTLGNFSKKFSSENLSLS